MKCHNIHYAVSGITQHTNEQIIEKKYENLFGDHFTAELFQLVFFFYGILCTHISKLTFTFEHGEASI